MICFQKWTMTAQISDRAVGKLLICFLSQVPLFEMDQEEDEEEDVLSMKIRGKEEKIL